MVISPREFGRVMSDAMYGLADVWKSLLVPALAAFIPVSLITMFVFRATGAADFLNQALNRPESLQTLPNEVFWELARPFLWSLGVATALQIAAGVFVSLASHGTVVAQIKGEPLTSVQATRLALARYPAGLGAVVLVVIATSILLGLGAFVWLVPALSVGTPSLATQLVALLLLAILLGPGVWAMVSASMTTAAIAVEPGRMLDCIRQSIRLVRGRWWQTAGFLFIVGFLGGLATQLIQFVAVPLVSVSGLGSRLGIVSALGVLAQGLLVAAIAAMLTHWYVDLRARKETLSIESLG